MRAKTMVRGMVSLLMLTQTAGAAQFHAANDLSVSVNNVSGDGKARSSLTEGTHYLDMLSLTGSGIAARGYEYTYTAGAKMTDDKRNDIKNFSFTNLQFRLSNGIHTYTAGDVLEYFSQYTMNAALKGLSWRYEDPASAVVQQAAVVYGIGYPRWDSFYGGTEVKSILRHAAGATARRSFGSGLSGGFSVAAVSDDSSSRITAADSIFKGAVYALDAAYEPFAGLGLRSELAFSGVTETPGGAADINHNGVAFKAEGTGVGGPSRVTMEYERVAPKFSAPLGAATPDREKVKARWRYKYTGDTSFNFGLLWYRNNLDGSIAAGGTTATRPEAGVSLRNVFDRKTAFADLLYAVDLQQGMGTSTLDHHLNVNYRDRFGIFDNDSSVSYAAYKTDANIRKNQEITANTSFNSRHELGAVTLRPGITVGVWNLSDDLLSKTNRITEYALSAGVDAPDIRLTSTVRVGRNKLDADVGDDADKLFALASAYWRPVFLEQFNGGMIYAKLLYNTYDYSTAANNFRESSITAGVSVQF